MFHSTGNFSLPGTFFFLLPEQHPDFCGNLVGFSREHQGPLLRATVSFGADSLEKTLMLGKIEGKRQRGWQRMRDEMVRQHHRLNGHEFEQTPGDSGGRASVAYCSPQGRQVSDMNQWLNNKQLLQCLSLCFKISVHMTISFSRLLASQRLGHLCIPSSGKSKQALGKYLLNMDMFVSECLCLSKIYVSNPNTGGFVPRRWGLWEVIRSHRRSPHE